LVEAAKLKAFTAYIGAIQQTLLYSCASKGSPYPAYDGLISYQGVTVALKETIRIMKEIDQTIPFWPIE